MKKRSTHYKMMTIQPWDVMKSWSLPEDWQAYCRLSAIKYIARDGMKPPFNRKEDAKKALDYLKQYIKGLR
jgi:hypothetical protein